MDYYAAVRAFLNSAECGSLSQAAQQMEVKTSTISRHIALLEADLGVALFNRSTRGLVLTEGGALFREHATKAMKAMDDARDIASSVNATPQGRLRVTLPVSFGRRHVIPHLPRFMAQYPDIAIDAVIGDEVVNLIDRGIDLAFRIGTLPDSQLVARKLAEHRRFICASPAYLDQHPIPCTPEELSAHNVMRFSLANDDKWFFIKTSDKSSVRQDVVVRLEGKLRANDTESLLDLTMAGCGIGLLPNWSVTEALANKKLVHLLPEWEARVSNAETGVWAVYPPKKTVSSKVRAFVDFFVDVYADSGYWSR